MAAVRPPTDEELLELIGPLVDLLLTWSYEGTLRCEAIVGRERRARVRRPRGVGGDKVEGVTGVATMFGLLIAIAVGMLLGAAISRPARTLV
jgi:hypothetical protein